MSMPVAKAGVLHRPRIEALLDQALNGSLITVVAGPGYGKTQAVASCLSATNRRVIWLRLLRFQNHPSIFWENFVESMRECMPDLAGRFAAYGFPHSAAEYVAFLRLFSQEIYAGEPVVLVADDYSAIDNEEIRLFWDGLIESRLENFCLILISSEKSNLNVAGMKNDADFFAITAEDLRFTEDEAEALLQSYGAFPSPEELRTIVANTDGWPLALVLLGRRFQNGKGGVADSKPHLLVAELFENEFFNGLDPDLQTLLVKLSLLPSFSADIVKGICGGDLPKALKAVYTHIFVSYDYLARRFVFQNMYRDFLTLKRSILDDDEVDRVYAVAGDCFLQEGRPLKAIDCYRKCRRYEQMLMAVCKLPKVRGEKSITNFVLGCLEEIPGDFAAAHPLVDFASGFMYLNDLQVNRAKEIFLRLKDRLEAAESGGDRDILLGETHSVLADISLLQNGDAFLEHLKMARDLLPTGSFVRQPELRLVDNNDIFFLPNAAPDQLDRMLDRVMEASRYLEAISNGNGYGFEWLYAAEAAFYTGRFDEAIACCFRAVRKGDEKAQHDIVCNARYLLMRVFMLRGDYQKAVEQLEGIRSYVEEGALTDMYELRDCAESSFYMELEDLKRVPAWVAEGNCDHAVQRPIGIGRNLLICAGYLIANRQYPEALAVLMQLEHAFSQKGLWTARLTAHLMRAECRFKTGDKGRALEELGAAYEMTYANGIVTPFIEFGSLMRSLIDMARKTEPCRFDPAWLNLIQQKASTYAKYLSVMTNEHNRRADARRPLAVRLSARELEVLRQLARGLTREEISVLLGISVNGVKKHITGIYNKLGAVNRADAVHIASTNGYI